jgi:hypothetical protein
MKKSLKTGPLQKWEGVTEFGERSQKIWFRTKEEAEAWSRDNGWREPIPVSGRMNDYDGPWRSDTHFGY